MTTKPTRWLASRLGRRGAALLVLGVIFMLVGLNAAIAPPDVDLSDRFLLHTLIPHPIQALLWTVPGILAIRASTHKGPGNDGFGFIALVVPLIIRIVSYLFSFVAYLFGAGTWPFGWAQALIWLAILALILIIAGWAEVPNGYMPKPPRTRRRWR
ncbi:membrane protein [Arthrobacter phage Phives]|uniref:Membrane protein n=1 Tax=Arthrobacter phage Phives TaxID=2776856 RepID=A0A7M1CL62_9CAUD|nr:membrane protein [Arthrobacter phage Phives]QOP65151.1 membrane protein [Arthrobacter phage Phives]